MIYRVDGTVIPETARECKSMGCLNKLECDLGKDDDITGTCVPKQQYALHQRMDCMYALLMPVFEEIIGEHTFRHVHRDNCAARDVLIRQHIANGGTLDELGIVGGYY